MPLSPWLPSSSAVDEEEVIVSVIAGVMVGEG